MMDGRLIRTIIAVCLLAAFLGGCGRKIVRPDQAPGPPTPGLGISQSGGSMVENDLQTIQAGLKTIYFDYDSYAVSPQMQADLQYNAELLRRAPQIKLVAEGHCDERGTAEYNLALGDRRARAVVDYLVGLGISPQRFSTVSYGSELPVDPAHNEAAWMKNRRVFLGVTN